MKKFILLLALIAQNSWTSDKAVTQVSAIKRFIPSLWDTTKRQLSNHPQGKNFVKSVQSRKKNFVHSVQLIKRDFADKNKIPCRPEEIICTIVNNTWSPFAFAAAGVFTLAQHIKQTHRQNKKDKLK